MLYEWWKKINYVKCIIRSKRPLKAEEEKEENVLFIIIN
jgi:hypothetical protein